MSVHDLAERGDRQALTRSNLDTASSCFSRPRRRSFLTRLFLSLLIDRSAALNRWTAAKTGVITYSKRSSNGSEGKPIFTCHPVEKPFCESPKHPGRHGG